jgi:hypothetical protein
MGLRTGDFEDLWSVLWFVLWAARDGPQALEILAQDLRLNFRSLRQLLQRVYDHVFL